MFQDIRESYFEADSAAREAMLLAMIRERRYDATLAPLIANEEQEFISHIAKALVEQGYCYLFVDLLCLVARQKDLAAAVRTIGESGFMAQASPVDLVLVDRLISTDNNPLYVLYQAEGSALYLALREAGQADFRTIYLWVRTQPFPTHEQLTLDFVKEYRGRPEECAAVIAEAMVTEREIAVAQRRGWRLSEYTDFLLHAMEAAGAENFQSALDMLHSEMILTAPSLVDEAENLTYLEFLRYAAQLHGGVGNLNDCYWRWLTSAAGSEALARVGQLIARPP